MGRLFSLCYNGGQKDSRPTMGSAKLAEITVKIQKIFRLQCFYGNLVLKIPIIICRWVSFQPLGSPINRACLKISRSVLDWFIIPYYIPIMLQKLSECISYSWLNIDLEITIPSFLRPDHNHNTNLINPNTITLYILDHKPKFCPTKGDSVRRYNICL